MRSAQAADAPELARLVLSAGTPREVTGQLAALLAHAASACLVATGYDGLSGVVALAWAPTLLQPRPVARITLLVVDGQERRRGIGRLLLKAASQAARSAGCDTLEIHAGGDPAADAFCRANGFIAQGLLFDRSLRKKAS